MQQAVMMEGTMTADQIEVCKDLQKDTINADFTQSDDEGGPFDFIRVVVIGERRKAREVAGISKYIDCSSTLKCFRVRGGMIS